MDCALTGQFLLVKNSNRSKFNGFLAVGELGNGVYDFGSRTYDASNGLLRSIDRVRVLAELYVGTSNYSFGPNDRTKVV